LEFIKIAASPKDDFWGKDILHILLDDIKNNDDVLPNLKTLELVSIIVV